MTRGRGYLGQKPSHGGLVSVNETRGACSWVEETYLEWGILRSRT